VAQITQANAKGLWPRQVASPYSLLRDARQLSVVEHLSVLSAATALVDDGVSKTVNLPYHAGVSDVEEVFKRAWSGGLKAISVYRDPKDSQRGSTQHYRGTSTS
jgi:ribonucleotide reductase alpha subunit